MSFFSFLFNSFCKKDRSTFRAELQVPCKFIIYPANEEPQDKSTTGLQELMKAGAVINKSSAGLGIITSPPFDKSYSEKVEKDHHIFIEAHSLQSNTHQKMRGKICWIKTILDVKEPYSEIGISILLVEDETQTQFLDALFGDPKDNKDNNKPRYKL